MKLPFGALNLLLIFLSTSLAETPPIIFTDGKFEYPDAIVEITSINGLRNIKFTVHECKTVLNSTIEGAHDEPFLVYWDSARNSAWWATRDIIKTYNFLEHSTAGHRYAFAEGMEKLDPPQRFIDAVRQNLK
jgi:hypothetical protein